MGKYSIKYLGLAAFSMFVFSNFIACGAQMYQVSLEEDVVSAPPEAYDPESPAFGIHSMKGWQNLPIPFKYSENLTEIQVDGLQRAMKTWETAVGRTLFKMVGTDERTGDSFDDLNSSLADDVNGHYLDGNWEKTNKSFEVLATTIWGTGPGTDIQTADIRFNDEYYTIGNSMDEEFIDAMQNDPREIVDMETLALHELGHLLGLAHVGADADGYSIMNPALFIGEGLSNRGLSEGDIRRAQTIYGCEGDSCNIESTIARLELSLTQGLDATAAKNGDDEDMDDAH